MSSVIKSGWPVYVYAVLFSCWSNIAWCQETNCNVSGIVRSSSGEILENAVVIITHLPTKSEYAVQTNSKGYFHVFNLKPGGPYRIVISYIGFHSYRSEDLFTEFNSENFHSRFHEQEFNVFTLQRATQDLQPVLIKHARKAESSIGTETLISPQLMKDMPTINRNLPDYLRLVPQSRPNADGSISFAGQNGKFNAFYIDGSSSLDLLGVAANGINGGQTLSPPISIEAIASIKVLISPFGVENGNFTGASINAITRSGSNEFQTSFWYYFRNQDMTGRSPEKDALTGDRTKLPPFFNNTVGAWTSGPLIKDKLFYFTSFEWQKEVRPQPFDMREYKGNSTKQDLDGLTNFLQTRYGYDPGSYDENYNNIHAARFITKLDWNPSFRHKFSFTYRVNSAERQAPQSQNGSTQIRFMNNGFQIYTNTNVANFEWRSFFKRDVNNRFLLTFTSQKDDRQILGKPFPMINIQDGLGSLVFGSSGSNHASLFNGRELALVDALKITRGRHVISGGTDMSLSWVNDLAFGNYYGNYVYNKLDDFLTDAYAFRYNRTLLSSEAPVVESAKNAGARFMTSRLGIFLQDEMNLTPDIMFRYGLRIDGNSWNTDYPADEHFNTVAVPAISKYYDLQGARSGAPPGTHWQVAPRVELRARIPDENVVLKIGTGIFTGHILNIWPSDIYNYRRSVIDIVPDRYNLRFNPDVNSQPDFTSLGLDQDRTKGDIVVVAEKFKYPTIWRTALSMEKKVWRGWNMGMDLILTRNIHEIRYTNVNLIPPTLRSAGPGSRSVYSTAPVPESLPMPGGNPYNSVLLMGNNETGKGSSYSVTARIEAPSNSNYAFTASYTYGASRVLFEQSTPSLQQWRSLETVNGRNNSTRSISDNEPKHRVYVYAMRRFSYAQERISTSVSLFYQGQSGDAYSYVYKRSPVNDAGANENFDLIYVPTQKELEQMVFVPITDRGASYTAEEQKEMLEQFIQHDKYLNSIRGSFAQRNGSRLPFVHTLDLRLQQEFSIKTGRKVTRFGIILDVFNFLAMLSPEWGRSYTVPNDNISLIRFEKYASSTDLTPMYQFKPVSFKPWSLQPNTIPGNSARWSCQLGFRFFLN